MKKLDPTLVRQLFVLSLMIFFGTLIFIEVMPYLAGVLGAITFYVLLRRWMNKMVKRGWNQDLAASTLMVGSFLGILMPIAGVILMLGSKISKAVANSERIIQAIKTHIDKYEQYFGYNFSREIDVSKVTDFISSSLQNLAGGTFDAVIAIGIMYFILYYLLTNRNFVRSGIEDYLPLTHDNLLLLGEESQNMVRANAIGIPLVAICQGIIALVGFLILGVPDPFFWFVITTIGSMIPFVGTALSIIPVTILLLSQGMVWEAVAILIYGIVVVGSTDNIIRLYVLRRLSDVHPLITLFGVVVGVPLFGFIGLIFGPLLVSLFLLIVRIYKKDYASSN